VASEPDFKIEIHVDPDAAPNRLVEVVAALIVERARKVVAARHAAAPSDVSPTGSVKSAAKKPGRK
jgi:hypothetical protein